MFGQKGKINMYNIGGLIIKIENHDHIPTPKNLELFRVDSDHYDHLYDIYVIDYIESENEKFVLNKNNIKIFMKDDFHKRYLYLPGDSRAYGLCLRMHEGHTVVYVQREYVYLFESDTIFASILSLEKRMYFLNKFILHSAYMLHNGEAILFSAPSGTGKSTQADLWTKYRGTRTINGDRTLISKENDQYFANGWPVCGSSRICFNETYPLKCIVFLSQAKENRIEKLDYKTKVKKLISELTINYHYAPFVNKVMDFIDDVIEHVPIYHLECDISENAVICLENQLKEDKIWMR